MAQALFTIIGFALATSFVGFNIVAACDKRCVLDKPELAGLSYLFGIGAISIEIFLFYISGIKLTTFYIILPWVILSIVNIPRYKVMANSPAGSGITRLTIVEKALIAMIALLIAYAFLMAMVRPIESYDSVAIWSLKAKVLYLTRAAPSDFFTALKMKFDGAHPDYPLLVPLSEVWFYIFRNNFNDLLVKVIFPLNFMAFLVLFYVFLRKALSGRTLALTFTFMLASIRQFSNYATNGYADLQMAIYASLTFLALYLWIRGKGDAYLPVAFFSCVFAFWTKNEGAVVLLGFILVLAFQILGKIKNGKRAIEKYRGAILAAAILGTLFTAWSLFKGKMGLQNDIVNAQVLIKYNIADTLGRLAAIFYEYQRQAFGIKYWNLAWVLFILASVFGFRKLFSEERRYLTIPIFFILLCYTVIYLITPQDLVWHLRRSASRLLIHILPLALFYVALETRRLFSGNHG